MCPVLLILVIEERGIVIELSHVLNWWLVWLSLVFGFLLLLNLPFLLHFPKLLVDILIEDKRLCEFIFELGTRGVDFYLSFESWHFEKLVNCRPLCRNYLEHHIDDISDSFWELCGQGLIYSLIDFDFKLWDCLCFEGIFQGCHLI